MVSFLGPWPKGFGGSEVKGDLELLKQRGRPAPVVLVLHGSAGIDGRARFMEGTPMAQASYAGDFSFFGNGRARAERNLTHSTRMK